MVVAKLSLEVILLPDHSHNHLFYGVVTARFTIQQIAFALGSVR